MWEGLVVRSFLFYLGHLHPTQHCPIMQIVPHFPGFPFAFAKLRLLTLDLQETTTTYVQRQSPRLYITLLDNARLSRLEGVFLVSQSLLALAFLAISLLVCLSNDEKMNFILAITNSNLIMLRWREAKTKKDIPSPKFGVSAG